MERSLSLSSYITVSSTFQTITTNLREINTDKEAFLFSLLFHLILFFLSSIMWNNNTLLWFISKIRHNFNSQKNRISVQGFHVAVAVGSTGD